MEYISISGQTKFSKNKKSKTKKSKGGLSAKEKKLLDDLDRELEENKPDKIYAFIGEKIEVKQFTPSLEKDEILMDSAFKAKYKIIQNVYGDY